MSILVEKNWQTVRPTIRERSKFMFNNELFSDVKFVARGVNGENESKQVIPAHKFVLSISSPLFEAMFYGELAETADSIEMPDCEYESLLELFRYMYSDEVNLSGSNLRGVLYLAKKYMVPSLADKCVEYLQDILDASNVFEILPLAQKCVEKNLVDQCWMIVDVQTEEALKSDGFVTIERSLLETVVERETLNIQEIKLFKAVNLWATKRCEKQGFSTGGSEIRKILGERIVKGIRFPVMTPYEFVSVVLDCKILTQDEAFSAVKYVHSVPETQVVFPKVERTGLRLRKLFNCCCRFSSVVHTGSGYPYSPDKQDSLYFEADKNICLLGVTLCGSGNCEYSVVLYLERLVRGAFLNVRSTRGNFSSERIKSNLVPYQGFDVFFDNPVDIKKGAKYHLEASISGSDNSCFGQNGQQSVVCAGVKFEFNNSIYSSNGTRVKRGQFPGLLFVVK